MYRVTEAYLIVAAVRVTCDTGVDRCGAVQPANVILVHGEETGMGRLKTELEKQFSLVPKSERALVFSPKNCVEVTDNCLCVCVWVCLCFYCALRRGDEMIVV